MSRLLHIANWTTRKEVVMKVHFPSFGRRHIEIAERPAAAHQIESDFRTAICRFVLDCSCGAHHDTPFIDEALEWRELHLLLAPLADELSA